MKQTQEQNKKEWESSVGLCQRMSKKLSAISPPHEGEPVKERDRERDREREREKGRQTDRQTEMIVINNDDSDGVDGVDKTFLRTSINMSTNVAASTI